MLVRAFLFYNKMLFFFEVISIYYKFTSPRYGSVAEWLGRGLQNLLQRFESARNLKKALSLLGAF